MHKLVLPRSRRLSCRGGFTLLEILIVLVIIGVLAGIGALRLGSVRRSAFRTQMEADLRRLAADQVMYFNGRLEDGRRMRYAGTLRQLGFTPTDGVSIRLRGDEQGWSAQATHESLGRRPRCAIAVGGMRAFPPATAEGIVTCE
jgi:prepilin-type N-terminal cleavage/methylation domain-containing protein